MLNGGNGETVFVNGFVVGPQHGCNVGLRADFKVVGTHCADTAAADKEYLGFPLTSHVCTCFLNMFSPVRILMVIESLTLQVRIRLLADPSYLSGWPLLPRSLHPPTTSANILSVYNLIHSGKSDLKTLHDIGYGFIFTDACRAIPFGFGLSEKAGYTMCGV